MVTKAATAAPTLATVSRWRRAARRTRACASGQTGSDHRGSCSSSRTRSSVVMGLASGNQFALKQRAQSRQRA